MLLLLSDDGYFVHRHVAVVEPRLNDIALTDEGAGGACGKTLVDSAFVCLDGVVGAFEDASSVHTAIRRVLDGYGGGVRLWP